MTNPQIVCFGEILWDLLPTGKIAGGAPMNVAYHINQLGLTVQMISKIGNDDLGKEILEFFRQKGISADLIQTDKTFPTGMARVRLDESGTPTYEFVQPASWDFIHLNITNKTAVEQADVFVFGSMAARNCTTCQTLFELLEAANLKAFDVNLRPPLYSKELLENLLQRADLVKMNGEELKIISEWMDVEGASPNTSGPGAGGGVSNSLKALTIKSRYDIPTLIVTNGANGAFVLNDNQLFRHSGYTVKVQDTIGSGDAFFAGFLKMMLKGNSLEKCLDFACALGAAVATKKGATPEIQYLKLKG